MTRDIIDAINDHVFNQIVLITICITWLLYWWKCINKED